MFNPIDKCIDLINIEYQSLQNKGFACYVLNIALARSPFHCSFNYKREFKELKKRICILTRIKKRFNTIWKVEQDLTMKNKVIALSQKIQDLRVQLEYMQMEEQSQMLLKCAAPSNLIITGSGDILRYTAYSLKFINATSYYLKRGSLDEIKRVTKAYTLASITSQTTQVVYQNVKSIKNHFTYSNFKALFTY